MFGGKCVGITDMPQSIRGGKTSAGSVPPSRLSHLSPIFCIGLRVNENGNIQIGQAAKIPDAVLVGKIVHGENDPDGALPVGIQLVFLGFHRRLFGLGIRLHRSQVHILHLIPQDFVDNGFGFFRTPVDKIDREKSAVPHKSEHDWFFHGQSVCPGKAACK